MAIRFSCKCGKKLAVRDHNAGKIATCPVCGRRIPIPASSEPSEEIAPTASPRKTAATSLPDPEDELAQFWEGGKPLKPPPPTVRSTTKRAPPPAPKDEILPAVSSSDVFSRGRESPQPLPALKSGSFPDLPLWCTLASDLDPFSILDALNRGRGSGLAVRIETSPGLLKIGTRSLPRKELIPLLFMYPFWAAWNSFVLFCIFLWPALFTLECIASFNFLALAFFPIVVLESVLEFYVTLVHTLQFAIEFFRAIYFLCTGAPYTFVPYGLHVENDTLADLTPANTSQVFRVSLSGRLLRRKTEKAGCLAVILLPFNILKALANMIRGKDRAELIAFVMGEPINLEAPRGFFARFKRKWEKRKSEKKRMVFLIGIDPGAAGRMEEGIREALGLEAIAVDDEKAKKTLWR